MEITRREFLWQTGRACLGYAFGAAAFAAGVERFGVINAFAQGNSYRALVCVFLAGGNDSNNMIIPATTTEYNDYASVRNASGLVLPLDTLPQVVPPAIGTAFGLHPSLAPLKTLWDAQKLSVVCNVGPLTQPLTREAYQAGARDEQIMAHTRHRDLKTMRGYVRRAKLLTESPVKLLGL